MIGKCADIFENFQLLGSNAKISNFFILELSSMYSSRRFLNNSSKSSLSLLKFGSVIEELRLQSIPSASANFSLNFEVTVWARVIKEFLLCLIFEKSIEEIPKENKIFFKLISSWLGVTYSLPLELWEDGGVPIPSEPSAQSSTFLKNSEGVLVLPCK